MLGRDQKKQMGRELRKAWMMFLQRVLDVLKVHEDLL